MTPQLARISQIIKLETERADNNSAAAKTGLHQLLNGGSCMILPDVEQMRIVDPELRRLLGDGAIHDAVERTQKRLQKCGPQTSIPSHGPDSIARRIRFAECMSDRAVVAREAGDQVGAMRAIQQAISAAPESEPAFQNLVALLLSSGELRDRNLDNLWKLLRRLSSTPWALRYQSLFHLPTFLNLEFVSGKCNLKCRMCVGRNAAGYPNKFSYVTAERFRTMVQATPSITGVTLSSGDSDPLLHPQIEQIVQIAAEFRLKLNIYTNGLPLSERAARAIVAAGSVTAMNFSLDAATAETYARIRGGNFERVLRNIRMLTTLRDEAGKCHPVLFMSFVAMADNVHELPGYVALAHDLGARRVFVGDLIGWLGAADGNHPATDNPRCAEYVATARRVAAERGVRLDLPERLAVLPEPQRLRATMVAGSSACEGSRFDAAAVEGASDSAGLGSEASGAATPSARLRACGWMNGVWVSNDGSMQPCCLLHNVADMGNIADGPLHRNQKYLRVKQLLGEGKVFTQCCTQRMCEYVQQQHTAGIPLRVITNEELGDLAPRAAESLASQREPGTVSLPVLATV